MNGLEYGKTVQEAGASPRNPIILKLFRFAKLSENADYGIDKIYSWERLTGEKVEFASDIMSATVTYWRPKVGTSVKRMEEVSESSEVTNPKTNPQKESNNGF